MNISTDNQSLYEACGQEGSDAQSAAFTILWSYVYRIAHAMLDKRPDGAAMAADCTQVALLKIHRNLAQCREPAAFRSWAAQIARRAVIDAVRQQARLQAAPLPIDEDISHQALVVQPPSTNDLRALLLTAIRSGPLSERSQRVVIGRFFDDQPDEALAHAESQLSGDAVLPSHIQVTRAKNLAKLRQNTTLIHQLRDLLGE
jgi:RNA polymerase sigma factor (sigma-70 family)